jgi:hypothetical protein
MKITAGELVSHNGHDLIGKSIETVAYGLWPGGPATIIKLQPDKMAPEIVFQVRSDKVRDPDNPKRFWEIGVFANEPVELLESFAA